MEEPIRDASMAPPDLGYEYDSQGIPLSHLPIVRLHIAQSSLSDRIAVGVQEVIRRHIRRGGLVLNSDSQPVAAGGKPEVVESGASQPVPVWNWNVTFQEQAPTSQQGNRPASDDLTWSCSTSSDTFAPLEGSSSSALSDPIPPVAQPFSVQIRYPSARPHLAFRGLGHVLTATKHIAREAVSGDDTTSLHPNLFARTFPCTPGALRGFYLSPARAHALLNVSQTAHFDTIGTMIDCSRNGVLNVESTKYLLRTLALLGYNMLQLYTEDTYQIDNEPYFGYMRGGYSHDELREIDDYAFNLGIEVIPCIQTLGHLGQMLQWPRYLGLRDTAEVLLPEWPETYTMLDKMIRAATAPFRSKKIHLGMDETHGLGHGRYYSIYGHQNAKSGSQIFVEHLAKVNEICNRLQLQPMIWSDMLFCLSAKNNSLVGYYDSNQPVEVKQQGGIPQGVDLVYWDYYHTSASSYEARIKNHEELRGASPWMASGSWTWSRFWTALPFSFQSIAANLKASRNSPGVRHVFLTIWGDEGNEVDLWSSLPAWVYYAEQSYSSPSTLTSETSSTQTHTQRNANTDNQAEWLLETKFDAVVGGNWADFVLASSLDATSREDKIVAEDDKIHFAPNTSKWMLWSDPVHSFVEPTLVASGFDAEEHYARLAGELGDRLEGVTFDTLGSTSPLFDDGFAGSSGYQSQEPGGGGGGEGKLLRILRDHPFNARLELARLVAVTLSYKSNLRQRLHEAYVSQDWSRLSRLCRRTRLCRDATRKLWDYHRQMWMSMYKPHGWETLELRYGGLVARLDTLYRRVDAFLRTRLQAASDGDVERGVGTGVFLATPTRPFDDDDDDDDDNDTNDDDDNDQDENDEDGDGDDFMNHRPSPTSRSRRRRHSNWSQPVTSLPELQNPLHVVYGSPEQLLDYHRVSRPTYC